MSRPSTSSRTTPKGTITSPPRKHLVDTSRGHRWAQSTPVQVFDDHEGNAIEGLVVGCLMSIPFYVVGLGIAWAVLR